MKIETIFRRSIRLKQTGRTCWTIQSHSDELNWARRRTFHELLTYYRKSFIKPPKGLIYLKPIGGGGGRLIETGGLFERRGLFNVERTMVSVLHKEVECSSTRRFRSWSRGSESHPNFQLVNKPSRISPHEVLQSWLINTVYHLLVKNN